MMKFITPILFATLFAGASATLEYSYECKDADLGDLDSYMIEKVGLGLQGQEEKEILWPFGKVTFVDQTGDEQTVVDNPDKLVAKIFLEFHEDKLKLSDSGETNDDGDPVLILEGGFEEVYVNVPEADEDCGVNGDIIDEAFFESKNIRIVDSDYAAANPPSDLSTCFPSTKQGQVGRIHIGIKDPLADDSPIKKKDGTIDFCYRVGYTVGEGVVSFRDTKVRGTVTAEGFFGVFENPVNIIGPDATDLETDIETKIQVEVALCNLQNEWTDNAQSKNYQIGQNYRLCVKSSDEKYEVEKFKDVACGSRQLVSDGEAADSLSEVFDGDAITLDSIAVKSVITATIIEEGTKDGGSIVCKGTVTLKKKDETDSVGRNLQAIASGLDLSGFEADNELVATPYDVKLNLVTPKVNLNNLIESSAPLPSSITATTAVAVIGFVVALFL